MSTSVPSKTMVGIERPPLLQLLDVLEPGGVLVDVDPLVGDPLFGEESLRALAVRAPRSAVDGDLGHQPSRVRSALTPDSVPRKRSTMLPLRVDDDHRRRAR